MKLKHLSLAAILPAAIAIASCDDDDLGFHATYFQPAPAGGMKFYADQDYDTIRVISYDSWTMKYEGDFFTEITPDKQDILPGYIGATRLDIHTELNQTNKQRSGFIHVTSSFGKIGTTTLRVTQLPGLNILSPSGTTGSDGKPDFNMQVKGNATSISNIKFRVFQENASLRSTAEWLTPDQQMFSKGLHDNVSVSIEPNTTNEVRTGMLILNYGGENGVNDTIVVEQLKI